MCVCVYVCEPEVSSLKGKRKVLGVASFLRGDSESSLNSGVLFACIQRADKFFESCKEKTNEIHRVFRSLLRCPIQIFILFKFQY